MGSGGGVGGIGIAKDKRGKVHLTEKRGAVLLTEKWEAVLLTEKRGTVLLAKKECGEILVTFCIPLSSIMVRGGKPDGR